MFSALRLGNPFYILEKGEKPVLKVGQVESVSQLQPKYQTYGSLTVETTVDLVIKVQDEKLEYKQVPSNLEIADYGNGIISESMDKMAGRVSDMLLLSKQIIESVDYHKNVVSACEEILKRLSPHYAKEKERDEAISLLNERVDSLLTGLDKIIGLLTKADK